MFKPAYIYLLIGGVLLSACQDLTASATENTLPDAAFEKEEVVTTKDNQHIIDSGLLLQTPGNKNFNQEKSALIPFIVDSEGKNLTTSNFSNFYDEQISNNEVYKNCLSIESLKAIRQRLNETRMQDLEAQHGIIQAIVDNNANIECFAREDCIPFILLQAERGEKNALLALLWLFRTYPQNHLFKPCKLNSRLYEDLLDTLKASKDNITIDSKNPCYLGDIYSCTNIKGLNLNINKSIKYYKLAIQMGNSNAIYNLGMLYHLGIKDKLESNASKAIKYYTKAIALNHANAANNLAMLYEKGLQDQLEPNPTKAIQYYEIAIQLGSAAASFNLALLYEKGIKDQLEPNASKAIQYYERAIEMGDADAANNLAMLYEKGIKDQLEPNASKAIQYYEIAIEMGEADVANNLAILYEKGIKDQLEPNVNKAIQYYEIAIQLGSYAAANNLALLYKEGIKDQLEPNASKAIQYYKIAIQLGSCVAANNLAMLYEEGIKGQLESNVTRAIEYYEIAIKLKNSRAANKLALLYEKGIKDQLEPNASKAIQYYEIAIQLGSCVAANNLAMLYKEGIKGQLEPSASKAIHYYEFAIQLGNAKAANNLAMLYKKGIKDQLEPNPTKAIEYYEKAIELGHAQAAFNLGLLYEYGIKGQLEPSKQLAFKTYHNVYLATKNKELYKHLKNFIVRNSSIDIVLPDLEESNQGLTIFIENVELLTGFMLLKQEENNPFSQAIHFIDNYMVPELLPYYIALSSYLDDVLEITKYLSEPAFMIGYIKIKSLRSKKYIENGDHLHEYIIGRNSYLCLGEENVKTAMLLIGLLENEHMVKQNIVEIKKILSESPDSELGKRLQEQAMKKLPESYAGSPEEYMAERLKETLDMLDKVEIVSSQLKEIVLATTSIRNKGCVEQYPFLFEK